MVYSTLIQFVFIFWRFYLCPRVQSRPFDVEFIVFSRVLLIQVISIIGLTGKIFSNHVRRGALACTMLSIWLWLIQQHYGGAIIRLSPYGRFLCILNMGIAFNLGLATLLIGNEFVQSILFVFRMLTATLDIIYGGRRTKGSLLWSQPIMCFVLQGFIYYLISLFGIGYKYPLYVSLCGNCTMVPFLFKTIFDG